MKILTILTQDYKDDLEVLLNEQCTANGTLYMAQGYVEVEPLAKLLERIVILEHPVYGHSPKLVEIAQSLHHETMHKINVAELTRYLDENDTLHLEGYTAFLMADYRHKLDMLMYCAIKKLKLADVLL